MTTNTDPSPASYAWTIDTSAPVTTITAKPSDPSADSSPSFSFTSSEAGSSFECQLDGAAYAACTAQDKMRSRSAGSSAGAGAISTNFCRAR